MERKRITCPESAHLEEIEFERTPYGLVIAGCSRFDPPCEMSCARECARRLDRGSRIEDTRDRVLVAYSRAAWTRPVATALAEAFARDGLVTELADLDAGAAPPPADYDAVVVATPQRLRRRARPAIEYLACHRDELAAMPSYWCAVGSRRQANPESLRRATGWWPAHTVAIVRPSWYVRWFGDPDAERAPFVRQLALEVGEGIPARELAL